MKTLLSKENVLNFMGKQFYFKIFNIYLLLQASKVQTLQLMMPQTL